VRLLGEASGDQGLMKRKLSILLRLLFAAAGIGYIAVSLTWIDHVEFPPGYALSNGVTLEKRTELPIEHETADTLIVGIGGSDSAHAGDSHTLARAALSEDPSRPRLKPGILTTLRHARWWLLGVGVLIVGPVYLIQSYRWLLLLRCRGLEVGLWRCFKLTMVGTFFNFCMPGTTGGDVIKAYYAAKRTERRGAAIMSVIFDRVTGLFGLVLLAAIASAFIFTDPLGHQVAIYVWITVGATLLAAALYFSRHVRTAIGLEWLTAKLPEESLIARVDRTARAYTENKSVVLFTTLISLPVHFAFSAAAALAGYALGMSTDFTLLISVLPLLMLAGAVPLTFQGLGVMEGLGMALLLPTHTATSNQIVGMLLILRLYMVFYGLLGSLFLLGGDIHLHPEQEDSSDAAVTDADTTLGHAGV
jgi:uncharacterized protein (TIRG00374 family)